MALTGFSRHHLESSRHAKAHPPVFCRRLDGERRLEPCRRRTAEIDRYPLTGRFRNGTATVTEHYPVVERPVELGKLHLEAHRGRRQRFGFTRRIARLRQQRVHAQPAAIVLVDEHRVDIRRLANVIAVLAAGLQCYDDPLHVLDKGIVDAR